MELAKELADENLITKDGGPFGACIVKDGIIVGRGNNQVLKNNDPTLHAEIVAIKDACEKLNTYDLDGCELYTNCYPCPMCLSAIMWANIKEVYYGNTKEDADAIGFRDKYIYDFIKNMDSNTKNESLELISIDRDNTIKTFQDFNNDNNKKIY